MNWRVRSAAGVNEALVICAALATPENGSAALASKREIRWESSTREPAPDGSRGGEGFVGGHLNLDAEFELTRFVVTLPKAVELRRVAVEVAK